MNSAKLISHETHVCSFGQLTKLLPVKFDLTTELSQKQTSDQISLYISKHLLNIVLSVRRYKKAPMPVVVHAQGNTISLFTQCSNHHLPCMVCWSQTLNISEAKSCCDPFGRQREITMHSQKT